MKDKHPYPSNIMQEKKAILDLDFFFNTITKKRRANKNKNSTETNKRPPVQQITPEDANIHQELCFLATVTNKYEDIFNSEGNFALYELPYYILKYIDDNNMGDDAIAGCPSVIPQDLKSETPKTSVDTPCGHLLSKLVLKVSNVIDYGNDQYIEILNLIKYVINFKSVFKNEGDPLPDYYFELHKLWTEWEELVQKEWDEKGENWVWKKWEELPDKQQYQNFDDFKSQLFNQIFDDFKSQLLNQIFDDFKSQPFNQNNWAIIKIYIYTSMIIYQCGTFISHKDQDSNKGRHSEFLLNTVYNPLANCRLLCYLNDVDLKYLPQILRIYNKFINSNYLYEWNELSFKSFTVCNIHALCIDYETIHWDTKKGALKIAFNDNYNLQSDLLNKLSSLNKFVIVKTNDIEKINNYIIDYKAGHEITLQNYDEVDGYIGLDFDIIELLKKVHVIFNQCPPLNNFYYFIKTADKKNPVPTNNNNGSYFRNNFYNKYKSEPGIKKSGGDLLSILGGKIYLIDSKRYEEDLDEKRARALLQCTLYMNAYLDPLIFYRPENFDRESLYTDLYLGVVNPLNNTFVCCDYFDVLCNYPKWENIKNYRFTLTDLYSEYEFEAILSKFSSHLKTISIECRQKQDQDQDCNKIVLGNVYKQQEATVNP